MRTLLNFLLKAAVTALLLYFAFSRVNFSLIGARLDQVAYAWLAAAVLIFVAQTALGALRWRQIVRHCAEPGARPFSTANALRYTFVATFFNQTLPSTVGGDAIRILLLGRDQSGWRTATYSVIIDRMVGVLVLAALVVACLPWSFALIGNLNGRIALLVVGLGSIGACVVFLAVGFVHWHRLQRWWLTRHVHAAASVALNVFSAPSTGTLIIVYSLLVHLMSVTAAWCLARAVAAPLEWSQALLLVLPVLLIATIPLSIAGWGARETAMVMAFGYAGLPESDGLIVSVLLGAAIFAVGLLGGAIWIFGLGKKRFAAAQTRVESAP